MALTAGVGHCATCGTAMHWRTDGWHRWVECECGEVIPREFFRTAWSDYLQKLENHHPIPPEGTAEEMAVDDTLRKVIAEAITRVEAGNR